MKTIVKILYTTLLLSIFIACTNDVDDKLDGKWQLQKIETDGNTISVDTIFYNFQTSLFMYQIYQPSTNSFRNCFGFKTVESGKQLALELVEYSTKPSEFIPYTDWNATLRNFEIEQLNNNKLILKGDNKNYIFRKF